MESLEDIQRAFIELQHSHQEILEQLQRGQYTALHIARQAWRSQEEERGRLARELHDGLGQNLTALKNTLTGLENSSLEQEDQQKIATAISLCSSCIEDTRSMSRMLRPAVLDDLGLSSALRQLCRSVQKQGLATELIERGDLDELSAELGTLVYRITQEATTNALKHANAKLIALQIVVQPKLLKLVIMDDGKGFDVHNESVQQDGFGLQAMRERVELFGGRVHFESSPGEGTKIRMQIPRNKQGTSQ